jgi:hypothetical protein
VVEFSVADRIVLGKSKHHFRTLFTCDICKSGVYFIEKVSAFGRAFSTISFAQLPCKRWTFSDSCGGDFSQLNKKIMVMFEKMKKISATSASLLKSFGE